MKTFIAFVAVAFLMAGCGEELNDASRVANSDEGAVTISMPDGFTNIAAKCFGTDMVYGAYNSNGRAVAVSPNHPWCEDGVLTKEEMQR